MKIEKLRVRAINRSNQCKVAVHEAQAEQQVDVHDAGVEEQTVAGIPFLLMFPQGMHAGKVEELWENIKFIK